MITRASIVRGAIVDAFRKLDPRLQIRNPVMFVVYIGSILTTLIGIAAAAGAAADAGRPGFVLAVSAWLWLTVLFANFAEAVAEGRGKAQAATLRSMRRHVHAKRLMGNNRAEYKTVEASALRPSGSAKGSIWPTTTAPLFKAPSRAAAGRLTARTMSASRSADSAFGAIAAPAAANSASGMKEPRPAPVSTATSQPLRR